MARMWGRSAAHLCARARAIPGVVGLLLLAGACTFDYSDARIEGELETELPSIEILNVRMEIVRSNRIVLTAQRIATYTERGIQEFSGLEFVEYGPDGEVRIEGAADRGELTLDTEDVELRGTVRFYSRIEDASLASEFLSWTDADRVLVGMPEGEVSIQRGDGSLIRGRGMRLDGRRNVLEFDGGVDGEFQGEAEVQR